MGRELAGGHLPLRGVRVWSRRCDLNLLGTDEDVMKDIREVAAPRDGSYREFEYTDYTTLIQSFAEVLVEVTDNDYQGDSRYLIRDEAGRFGVCIVGWGSCSGCDALAACSTYKELEELRNEIAASVQWFDSAEACGSYLGTKDWETSYLRKHETEKFVAQAIDKLARLR